MPNNIYRFRRIKWGEPKRFKAMPPTRPAPATRRAFAILAGVVVIGAVVSILFQAS